VDFDFPNETHSYDSGKSKKQTDKPFAPALDTALAGLGPAATEFSARVPYISEQPMSGYDQAMRSNNPNGTVLHHCYSSEQLDLERIGNLGPGQTMKDLPSSLWHDSFRRRAFRRVMDGTPTEKRGGAPAGIKRLKGDLNCLTITSAAIREFIHPSLDRPLTLRECARIQSFSDNFEFRGNALSIAQQIGNAVPPLAAHVFAHHLAMIDGTFGSDVQAPAIAKKPRFLGFHLTDAAGMSDALRETQRRLALLTQAELALEI
jgi:DNA (cytosine-5)-methyltransferase 1